MLGLDFMLVRLLRGKYSHEFVQFHRDKNRRSPFSPCYKDDAVFHFIKFFEKQEQLPVYSSQRSIQFAEQPFFIRQKQLLKSKGKPDRFSVTLENKVEIKTFGYNTEIFSAKARENYYFVDGLFFMGEFIFSDAAKMDEGKLFSSIASKYLNKEDLKQYQKGNFYLKDSFSNEIHVDNNGFSIGIRYFSQANESVANKLDEFLEGGRKKSHADYSSPQDENDFNRL